MGWGGDEEISWLERKKEANYGVLSVDDAVEFGVLSVYSRMWSDVESCQSYLWMMWRSVESGLLRT